MVRRRSTVRFRKGAPGQRQDPKDPNKLVGPKVGPTGLHSRFTFAVYIRESARSTWAHSQELVSTGVCGCPEWAGRSRASSRPRSSQVAVVYLTTRASPGPAS